jgi:hypothetical protein
MPKTPEEIAAEAKAAADKILADKAAADALNGFPSDTPVADMKPEEQVAYWRNESKKQQKRADGMSDYEQRKADSEELARVKAANATEQEKAVEEARKQGENIGADKYLPDAVKGRFQALTGKTDEEVDTAFAFVDPKSFLDDKGVIDATKLKAYADVFGKNNDDSKTLTDPVAAALAAKQKASGGSGSSMADKRKETREKLTPPTKA